MSKAFKCDRCGQFYAPYKSEKVHSISDAIKAMADAIKGLLVYKMSYQIMRMKDGNIDEEINLCPGCQKSFEYWLKNSDESDEEDESQDYKINFEPVNLKGYEFSSSSDIAAALRRDENDPEEDNM